MSVPDATGESQNWIRTIEEEKGYAAVDAAAFRGLLTGMHRYAFYRALLRYIHPGADVLEAGCGWALASFALAELGMHVTALDISDKLIISLQRLQAELGEPFSSNLMLVTEDIFRLHLRNRVYDAVFSDGTYEHFSKPDDRQRMLATVRAILKEKGTLIVTVPNLHNPFFTLVVDPKMPAMHPFTLGELARELERGGFRVLEKGYSFVNPGFAQ